MAENVSETITRGARVMVAGRLEQRSWETQEGDKRSKVEVVADEIGPSLRWATAQITKNERRGAGDGRGGARSAAAAAAVAAAAAAARPSRSPAGGRRWRRIRIRRGALLMARNNQRGGSARRAPKDLGRRVKKKPCALCRDKVDVGRLQGRPHAAQVHERPGQDPLAPGDGELRAAPAGVGQAIKTARELVLLPYTQRTVTERPGGRRGDRERPLSDTPPPPPPPAARSR